MAREENSETSQGGYTVDMVVLFQRDSMCPRVQLEFTMTTSQHLLDRKLVSDSQKYSGSQQASKSQQELGELGERERIFRFLPASHSVDMGKYDIIQQFDLTKYGAGSH